MSSLTTVTMPTDSNAAAIQTLAPSTIVNVAVTGSSAATAIPAGAVVVEVAVDQDAYIEFGLSGQTAVTTSSSFFPKGVAVYRIPDGATHLAHIRHTTSGRITMTSLI